MFMSVPFINRLGSVRPALKNCIASFSCEWLSVERHLPYKRGFDSSKL